VQFVISRHPPSRDLAARDGCQFIRQHISVRAASHCFFYEKKIVVLPPGFAEVRQHVFLDETLTLNRVHDRFMHANTKNSNWLCISRIMRLVNIFPCLPPVKFEARLRFPNQAVRELFGLGHTVLSPVVIAAEQNMSLLESLTSALVLTLSCSVSPRRKTHTHSVSGSVGTGGCSLIEPLPIARHYYASRRMARREKGS